MGGWGRETEVGETGAPPCLTWFLCAQPVWDGCGRARAGGRVGWGVNLP